MVLAARHRSLSTIVMLYVKVRDVMSGEMGGHPTSLAGTSSMSRVVVRKQGGWESLVWEALAYHVTLSGWLASIRRLHSGGS